MKFKNYEFDRFQAEAAEHIEAEHSLIVSAPTGAGKTVIAEYAIEHTLKKGKEVIYTAPIKALSSQKFRDLKVDYGDRVGILTGDIGLNTGAPIMIMTTEIFRNTIFDNPHRLDNIGHVIFDEVHYLDDVERGTVWEESIIFAPPQVRFVCLSATIPNLDELANWMASIRTEKVAVVTEDIRPVPLHHFFYADGTVHRKLEDWNGCRPRGGRSGRRSRRGRRGKQRGEKRQRPERPEARLIKYIRERGQIPCLYFVFSRKRCEELAGAYRGMRLLNHQEREEILDLYDRTVESYGITSETIISSMRELVSHGVGYHHAGLLPSMKEVVERLFVSGLLKLIFTTSTFALGINMPARAVVIDELNSYNGVGFADMTVRNYYQMAGRAGRRGMDKEGLVYARLDARFITPDRVRRIVYGTPEEVKSQLNTCFATILNLIDLAGDALYEAYEKSFHNFLADDEERIVGKKQIERKVKVLSEMEYVKDDVLTEKGAFAARLYGYELQAAEFLFSGLLDDLDPLNLAVLAMGACYESRMDPLPSDLEASQLVAGRAGKIVRRIRAVESAAGLTELTPELHFGMSTMVVAWMEGRDFETIKRIAMRDEGEIVRNLRRTIQLLREIRNAASSRGDIAKRISEAITILNRDVVDAERQLLVD